MTGRIFTGILIALSVALSTPFAFGQDVLPQLEEARSFFTRAAQQNSNPYIVSMARENLKRLEAGDRAPRVKVEIPLVSGYDSLAVPVLLNRSTPGRFIVDTGATHTVITPEAARRLGITITSSTPTVTLLTANGRVQAPVVTLPELSIGQVRAHNIPVIVQDLGGDDMLSGLLGMNFFKDKNLQILSDRLILEVEADDAKIAEKPSY